jgi:hypothetical protein
MQSIKLLRMSALMAALVLAAAAVGQPPDRKLGPPGELARPAPIQVDDIVERIMSFDKNKDGKVTKDELPERMQFLVELGDTNKDGALDRDEIKKLVTTRATTPGGFGADGFGTGGFARGEFRQGGFKVGPGPGPGPGPGARLGVVEGVVDDLKLSTKKKDLALAAVKAHQESVRKLMDQAHAELLQKMKTILSEEELKDFIAALDRPRSGVVINDGPLDAPKGGARKPDQPRKP